MEFCKVALTFMSVDKSHGVTIQMKSLWKYFHGVLFYEMKFGIFVEFAFGHIWQ